MNDRFFEKKAYIEFGTICKLLSIEFPPKGSPRKHITDVARLDNARNTEITFFHNPKYAEALSKTNAYACVITKQHEHLVPENTIALVVDEPYYAHALLLKEFYSIKYAPNQDYISSRASIAKSAMIEEGCYISDYVTILDDVVVKKGTFIGSNVTILPGVEIGENSHIESNVTIGFAVVGRDAYIKSGTRIGQQGFGFHVGKNGITDVLQIGKVVIGDDVQIGANCTIDRGSMNDTVIGSHCRIDNLVHVAHNVEIGDYCIIAAQTGIAGSSKIGSRCVLGGQVGISGHLSIGDNVTIAAQSGVMRNVQSGKKVAGAPSTDILSWHRQTITLQRLSKTNPAHQGKFAKLKHLLGW